MLLSGIKDITFLFGLYIRGLCMDFGWTFAKFIFVLLKKKTILLKSNDSMLPILYYS